MLANTSDSSEGTSNINDEMSTREGTKHNTK